MPSIKMEQIKKYNNQLHNGWLFDGFFYVGYSEKQAVKIIQISDNERWRFTLRFHPLYTVKKNDFGQKFSVENGWYSLSLTCQPYRNDTTIGDTWVSTGGMKYFNVGERNCTRRVFSEIIHRSKEFTDEKCMEYTTMEEPIDQFLDI